MGKSMLPAQTFPYHFPVISGLGAMLLVFLYLLAIKQIDPSYALNRTTWEIYLWTFIPTFLLAFIIQYFISVEINYMAENVVIIAAVFGLTLLLYNFAIDLSFISVLAFTSIYFFEDIRKKRRLIGKEMI